MNKKLQKWPELQNLKVPETLYQTKFTLRHKYQMKFYFHVTLENQDVR